MNNKTLHLISYALLWIGGLNWGLIGLFGFNLVEALFGSIPALPNIIYILVALAAIYTIWTHKETCKVCSEE
jgi:uncharacterized membrane protein YuzA (DUF378 family)